MKVEQIFFAKTQWVGFLGYHKDTEKDGSYSESQYFEIFSQLNLSRGVHTIKAKPGHLITDVAIYDINTFAIASQDGSVTVK